MPAQVSPLFVSSFGAGRPIVCLHGIEAQGVRFIGMAQRLPGMRVVAPDLRGHGRSPKHGRWTVDEHMDDLRPLLTQLAMDSERGERPLLLGHSYGGFLAWQLAGRDPGAIAALILVDPAINVSEETDRFCNSWDNSAIGHSWPTQAEAIAELTAGRPPSGAWSGALDGALATEKRADGRFYPVVAQEAVTACWVQIARPHTPNGWRGPTLLLEAGHENGKFINPGVIGQMRAQLGAALTHVVMDATHTIPSDYPDELAHQLRNFLRALGPPS